MRTDVLKHLTNVVNAIEELLVVHASLTDEKKIEMDTRLEEKIKNLQSVIEWSKNE